MDRCFLKKALVLVLALSCYGSVYSMEGEGVATKVRVGEISDCEWTLCGSWVLVACKDSQDLFLCDRESQIKHTVKASGLIEKLVRSPFSNYVALALKGGRVEVFDGDKREFLPQCLLIDGRSIISISWVTKEQLLVYVKDVIIEKGRSEERPLRFSSFKNTSTLRVFNVLSGAETNTYTLDNHLVDIKVAPSGAYCALVFDLINRKEELLEISSSAEPVAYRLSLYTLDNLKEPKADIDFDSKVSSIAWSADSERVAVLLRNGCMKLFNTGGLSVIELNSEDHARSYGRIAWSNDGLLAAPKMNAVCVYDPDQPNRMVKTVWLCSPEEFQAEAQKGGTPYYYADFIAWHPTEPVLLIASGNKFEESSATDISVNSVEREPRPEKRRRICQEDSSDV